MSVNKEKLDSLSGVLEEDVLYFNSIVDKTVESYTKSLDDIMEEVHTHVVSVDEPSTDVIEKYFLELSNCIYFISTRLEKVGIYESLSKIMLKSDYNNNYLNPVLDKAKPTVAELTAYAEQETLENQVLNEIYARAYKIIKGKIDAASTMISSLSKSLSRRMQEMQLSNMQPIVLTSNGKRVLNEEM